VEPVLKQKRKATVGRICRKGRFQAGNERVRIYLRFLSAALMAVRRTDGITTGVESVVLAAAACNNHSQQLNSTARLLQWLHTHTHTHSFNGPFSGTTRVSQYQKGKPIWILLEQETVSGSGISWAICTFAPCSRQIPRQHPTTQFFTGLMPFLPPNQQGGRKGNLQWLHVK